MRGHERIVEALVVAPSRINQSAAQVHREIYIGPSTGMPSPFDLGYIRVVVDFSRGHGYILTAFHTLRPVRLGEVQIWPT